MLQVLQQGRQNRRGLRRQVHRFTVKLQFEVAVLARVVAQVETALLRLVVAVAGRALRRRQQFAEQALQLRAFAVDARVAHRLRGRGVEFALIQKRGRPRQLQRIQRGGGGEGVGDGRGRILQADGEMPPGGVVGRRGNGRRGRRFETLHVAEQARQFPLKTSG